MLRWIPDAELLDLPLWEGDRSFIPWLDRPGFFSARFVYEGERVIDRDVSWYHRAPQG